MIRLAVRVDRAHADVVLAELIELVPAGVEETDLGDAVEYAIYGAPGELPELPDVEAAAGGALVSVTTAEIADDWADRWRAFHHTLVVADRLAVRPPWEDPVDGVEHDVVIDPGRAFGTGGHATTRLCLEALLELDPGGPVLDLGCGSGVLAIAAAKLGFGPVLATDFDPLAVDATAANAAANGVAVDVARADLRTDGLPEVPLVLANLLRPLLLGYAGRLAAGELPVPRTLVASGLLAGEEDAVVAEMRAAGLAEMARGRSGEWAFVRLVTTTHP